jgi:hypothetical protein
MDRYIGIDVHARSCTVSVVDASGKRVGEHVVETNGQALIECLRMIPGQRHVCIEEGTQSAWLWEILTPHAQELVVTNVTDSRGPKSDQRDAFGLAEKLRVGAIEHRVYKDAGAYRKLRELGRVHSMVVRDSVRVQNRIKAGSDFKTPICFGGFPVRPAGKNHSVASTRVSCPRNPAPLGRRCDPPRPVTASRWYAAASPPASARRSSSSP